MSEVVYANDTRYPGPKSHPAPANVTGLPTQAELDAYPRLFTWGELKEIIMTGQLGQLMRNTEMQYKYDQWSAGMKKQFVSTENYLVHTRLPFKPTTSRAAEPTYDLSTSLDQPQPQCQPQSLLSPPTPASGSSTPSSVGFVSLASLKAVNGKLSKGKSDGESGEEEEEEHQAEYLRYDNENGLDPEKYAVLPNDWPYNVPYGVRHFCVWSKVPIAHPLLIDFDPAAWAKIEDEGLGGFTGVAPALSSPLLTPPSSTNGAATPGTTVGRGTGQGQNQLDLGKPDWYARDLRRGGKEMARWSGVEYESAGGAEVGKMVKGLWDERGWECIWFVNPPRLQSVPGFSHFHVFARRKTPEEIDAAEARLNGMA
ncbi:hypothetical protein CI109_100047 [Kwoniella shandongensis]|uniref:Uncharacterized protein n=1 Tax=Kwoniella shandongensis TaxID=1734106 RepID=A0A5M6BUI0_9TREE|nr:uncharacterized protein CI109_005980 [Kwoniella shandongensis]KAA5525672.1 hypothetical protein CI109_005980 [Kwoniella shandongensis]